MAFGGDVWLGLKSNPQQKLALILLLDYKTVGTHLHSHAEALTIFILCSAGFQS
jgi:hypothetical protein